MKAWQEIFISAQAIYFSSLYIQGYDNLTCINNYLRIKNNRDGLATCVHFHTSILPLLIQPDQNCLLKNFNNRMHKTQGLLSGYKNCIRNTNSEFLKHKVSITKLTDCHKYVTLLYLTVMIFSFLSRTCLLFFTCGLLLLFSGRFRNNEPHQLI